jgi:FHA domain-containing protein
MILTLLAVSLNEKALSVPITAHFDSRGGTLGRADHNTMALPDPERHVSRLQAEIIAGSAGFLIRNVGTTNPILVGGHIVAPGESAGVAPGDEIRVGGYLLRAESRTDDDVHSVPRSRAMSTPSPSPSSSPSPGPGPSVAHSATPSTGPQVRQLRPGHEAEAPADPFADFMPLSTNRPVPAHHLPDDFDPFAPPTKAPSSRASVVDANDGRSAAAPITPQAQPAAWMDKPAAAPLAAAPASRGSANDTQRLWAALCQGAGVNLPTPTHLDEERFRDIGRLLRNAVEGTLHLMAVRASTRHELRASITVIQARGNNPMKFSPDAKAGLEYLLQPPASGFLSGPAAMQDSMHDLVGHAIGTVAGMRAAIDGMLERFAPQALESKLTTKSVLDSVLPLQRKAKLWDLYLQHHESIRADAQDDFHSLFGKAFLAAYDEQIDQLKRNPPSE